MVTLAMVSCEQPEVQPTIDFNFGTATATVEEQRATITAEIPYYTLDGQMMTNGTVSLGYRLANALTAEISIVESYTQEGDKLIFTLEGLVPESQYNAYIILDAGKYGSSMSPTISFTTERHIPVCAIDYTSTIEARGIIATLKLNDIAYKADDSPVELASLKVEYAPKGSDEWVGIELTGSDIEASSVDVTLPAQGSDYLAEMSDYRYRITLTPQQSELSPITGEEHSFTTTYSVITARISTPELTVKDNMLGITINDVEVLYDGVAELGYKGYVHYRAQGSSEWNKREVATDNNTLHHTIMLASLKEDTTYEVRGAIVAGAANSESLSEVATITTPKSEEPLPPVVGGDTTSIAGCWTLTLWRGAEPTFDIYMDISTDGCVTLYQRMESRQWETFVSAAAIEDGIISGTYTDGVAWSTSYGVVVDGDTMTWTSTLDSGDVSVYERCVLPDEIFRAGLLSLTIPSSRFL